jgi:hypothetical protein
MSASRQAAKSSASRRWPSIEVMFVALEHFTPPLRLPGLQDDRGAPGARGGWPPAPAYAVYQTSLQGWPRGRGARLAQGDPAQVVP